MQLWNLPNDECVIEFDSPAIELRLIREDDEMYWFWVDSENGDPLKDVDVPDA